MQNTIPTLGTISWGRRLMPAAALALLLAFGFAQQASAQCPNPNPLCLSNNYFVTGDYVTGAVGLRGLGVNGFATGTITIPDAVQAQATGVPSPGVPVGARIDAAFLYWETVESTAQLPPHPGQNGSFNGYPITGKILGNPNAPTSWSSGGCSGSSLGVKTIVAYRADVRPFLPVAANGSIQTPNAATPGSYQVMLADSGSNGGGVPLTLGATLVIIYSVQSPLVPLNSIVLYDGAFAPSNQTAGSEMTQTMQGFYQAAVTTTRNSTLTHIVGDGQPNKSESVTLNSAPLPNLYPALSATAAFPGVYNGSWDTTRWSFSNANGGSNPVGAGDGLAVTSVIPSGSGGGCVDWGAVIFSTTVEDTNHDGLLAAWKAANPPGYTDAISAQNGISNPFVALPGASTTAQDIFVEIDYLSNLDGLAGPYLHSHLPKQLALDMVGDAFAAQGVHVHFDVGTKYNNPNGPPVCKLTPAVGNQQSCPDPYIIQGGTGGNPISESVTLCNDSGATLCAFPGTPAVAWKGGFLSIKQNASVPNSNPPIPLGKFQPGRKDSYHYVLFGHALGAPRSSWTAFGATLQSPSVAKLSSIMNSGTTATVTIHTPQGLVKPGDCNPANPPPACSDANGDRVSVTGAIGQPALNGTYHFTNLINSGPDNNNVTTTTFTITTTNTTATCTSPPCVADGTYKFSNESQLEVVYGGPTSTSGHSDVGGGDTAVTFGLWPADDVPGCQADPSVSLAPGQTYCTNQVGTITAEAGTLLHELGHTLFLTHGGTFFPNGTPIQGQQINNPLGLPSYGLNCNPAFLSSMNYLFQIRGFPDGGIDYSGQTLPSLSETALDEGLGIGSALFTPPLPAPPQQAAHFTRWYAPPNALDIQLQNTTGGRFATRHCNGSPIGPNEPPAVRVEGSTFSAPIDWNNDLIVPDLIEPVAWQDVNFNGSTSRFPDPAPSPAFNNMQGFNDWINVDLRQVGSRANAFGLSSGGNFDLPGGGNFDVPGGGNFDVPGGGNFDVPGGGTEQDSDTANSTADAPTGLSAVQSDHNVVLNWTAPGFGQVRRYDIWRAVGSFPTLASVLANRAQFTNIGKVNGAPPSTTFTDTDVKNKTTFTYFVTDTNKKGVQSGASAPATKFVSF